ncbi:Uncharacterised protein at_DN0557 [Pycnogonum litorale]
MDNRPLPKLFKKLSRTTHRRHAKLQWHRQKYRARCRQSISDDRVPRPYPDLCTIYPPECKFQCCLLSSMNADALHEAHHTRFVHPLEHTTPYKYLVSAQ